MVNKQLIGNQTSLSRSAIQKLTTKNISLKLMVVMKEHIGFENAITREDLFKEIFEKPEDDSLGDWLRWEFVKKAMNLCRRKSKCFISSKYENGGWIYFVVKDIEDAGHYIKNLNKTVKRIRAMQLRAMKSVDEKWHEQDWILERKERKKISHDDEIW